MLAGWVVVIVIIIHMHASLVHSNFITTELYHDVPSMPSEVDRMDVWMGIIFYYTVHYLGAKDDVVVLLLWVWRGGINTMMDREVHRRRRLS